MHPRFKPDWSLAHVRSTPYLGEAVVLRGQQVAAAGGVSLECCRHGNYDLVLRVLDAVGDSGRQSIAHIPAVLFHRGGRIPLSHSQDQDVSGTLIADQEAQAGDRNESSWCMQALCRHLARSSVAADVVEAPSGGWRVRYRLPEPPPLVSIIVPTRDTLPLIRRCLDGLLKKTTYPRFEILVVDNQTSNADALAYLQNLSGRSDVRVLRYDRPFNFSGLNNHAAAHASGEVLCLLNNDTEVISPDWLEEMVGQLTQDRVAVVGAKLYYPDGRVQHGGDVLGIGGIANHLHAYVEHSDMGYCRRAMLVQDLSAVTAACLVTWRRVYLDLGGLDEQHLPVAFNDVDYCLRLREAGYRVVWTPYAELYHDESASRGEMKSAKRTRQARQEAAYMRRRWAHVMRHDPFYNPNLSHRWPDFSLCEKTPAKRPWR